MAYKFRKTPGKNSSFSKLSTCKSSGGSTIRVPSRSIKRTFFILLRVTCYMLRVTGGPRYKISDMRYEICRIEVYFIFTFSHFHIFQFLSMIPVVTGFLLQYLP